MFHRAVSGINAYNLDPFFLDGDGLRSHLSAHGGQISIIEGAMGYYDGIAATDEASAYTVAKETRTPAILVVSAKGAGHSLAAMVEGYARHRRDSQIKGVLFNDANESRYPDLKRIAKEAGIQAFGTIPRSEEWTLPSRHLGLLRTDEIPDLQSKLSALGRQAGQSLDIDGLLALAEAAPKLAASISAKPQLASAVRLAVSRDEAFCFRYEENLEILQSLGCELVFFSPLRDNILPANSNGLYLCGGYPENYAGPLSDNASMRESVRQAALSGLPVVAECGGFLYLHDTLDGFPMCGVIHGAAYETKRLQRFGYITLIAGQDNLLCKAGESIRAHEFHYWDSNSPGAVFTAQKAGRGLTYPCVHATDTLYAGFPHLYFPANRSFAKHFVERMAQYEP
jgi:cobyrinic acid a,c-diamide synthase